MDFEYKKIIAYAIGVLVIALWAVFDVFSYEVSMLLTSLVLIGCFAIEAQEAKQLHRVVSYRIRIGAMSVLVVGLVLLAVNQIF